MAGKKRGTQNMAGRNKGGAGALPATGRGLNAEDVLALFAVGTSGGGRGGAGGTGKAGKKSGRGRVLPLDEIARLLGTSRRRAENILGGLTAEGRLVRLKGPAYALPEALPSVTGRISLQRSGIGFVRPADGRGQDVYVHQSQIGGAWNGDLVRAALLPGRHGKSPEGRVTDVLERSVAELAVELLPELVDEGGGRCRLGRPLDPRMPGYVLVDFSGPESGGRIPGAGSVVLVRVRPVAGQHNDGVVRVSFSGELGRQDSIFAYERVIKASHGIAVEFPAAVAAEARKLPEDPAFEADGEGWVRDERGLRRMDLRHIDLVTIDGADAKDFDDAVQVEKTAGGYLLRVAIADVAHYVESGSPLDAEARARGNSCYFPSSVEPMLPFELSGGLCSLRPGQPRLAMLAEVNFDPTGRPGKTRFYPALIRSAARLVYEEVQGFLDGKDAPDTPGAPDASGSPAAQLARDGGRLGAMLRVAAELARLLAQRRRERGALDFDLPEPLVRTDRDGRVRGLEFRRHLFAHSLIEEFMIAANEAVARYLAAQADGGLSFLYRVHPAPDPEKLRDLAELIKRGGLAVKLPEIPSPRDLQAVISEVRGRPEEYVVNRMLLRSLMQARYTPEREGHFGLASEAYCHFTSPIRRYADLCVHRALRRSLGIKEKVLGFAELAALAEGLNECERRAQEAERDINKSAAALYLQGREGEVFEAVVSGLSAFGVFVELGQYPVEGFVPLESLGADYFQLRGQDQLLLGQMTGRSYRPGQKLAVRLRSVNHMRMEIDFELADPDGMGGNGGRGRGRGSGVKPARQSERTARPEKPGRAGAGKKPSGGRGSGREGGRKKSKGGSGFRPGSVRVRPGRGK